MDELEPGDTVITLVNGVPHIGTVDEGGFEDVTDLLTIDPADVAGR